MKHYVKTLWAILVWLLVTPSKWLITNIPRTKYRWSLMLNALTLVYITWVLILFPTVLAQAPDILPDTKIVYVEKEAPICQPDTTVYDKDWALEQWEKIGQRDNALLVFFEESGLKQEAWYCNDKGSMASLDIGFYQWNSQHFKTGRITLECAVSIKCSTEKAIEMYQEQGFTPWFGADKFGLR